MSKWQPIETAPKDGTRILGARQGKIVIVRFEDDTWVDDEGWGDNSGWVDRTTHWMPLPNTPE